MEGFLAAGDRVELDVNVALAVGIDSNMENLAVLLVTLGLDLTFEILDPAVAEVLLFPKAVLAISHIANKAKGCLLVSVKCVLDLDTF